MNRGGSYAVPGLTDAAFEWLEAWRGCLHRVRNHTTSQRKVTCQLARAVTAQNPLQSPLSG